jgi:apolipoprotein N-acyltransferase
MGMSPPAASDFSYLTLRLLKVRIESFGAKMVRYRPKADVMTSAWFWVLLALSMVGTVLCWVRVFKSEDVVLFKVAGYAIAAIPFLGPFIFLFFDMPPRIPEEAQAQLKWRVGTTLYTDITRQLFQGNRRYVRSTLGTPEPQGPNREWRRATSKKADRDESCE